MKVFVVVLSAVLLASVALAHPHHHLPHHHSSPEDSSDSDSHDSSDCGKPKPPVRPELQEYLNDLRDFVALYPIDEIKQIIGEHLEDPELQATIAFLQSDEFEDLAEQIVDSPEVQAVLQYLKDADWPWAKKMLKAALQQRRALRNAAAGNETVAGGGLDGLLDDIIAVLPKEELQALFYEKLENSPVFRAVIEILTSDELRQLLENVKNSETLRPIFDQIAENGIHGEKIHEFLRALYGF